MGMTGRKPTPAAMIDPEKHKKSQEDIELRKEVEKALLVTDKLRCPKYVSDEAKREWRRIMKLYRAMDVSILSDLDVTALVMYCEATAIYKKAQETWVRYNAVVASNPEAQRILDKTLATMERQTKILNQLAEQLCLTPVGRARMGMMAVKDNRPSELDDLLGGDR